MPKGPIKRHQSIQPISRDHHHGLLVGWKIRTGIRLGISPDRIFRYVQWFHENWQLQHFEEEETWLFPILGMEHELVVKALAEHQEMNRFIENESVSIAELAEFEKLLTSHIRFEERQLFNLIEEEADDHTLRTLETHLVDHPFAENTTDEFWLTTG